MRQIRYLPVILSLALLAGCGSNPSVSREERLKSGDQYLADGKLDDAIVEYRGAVAAEPTHGPSRVKLADAYMASGDIRSAAAHFVQAADRMPEDAIVQMKTAEALIAVGKYEDARARLDKVVAADPSNARAYMLKGNAMAGLKDLGAAISQMESSIRLNPTYSPGYTSLGSLQLVRGDIQEAEISFKRAVFTAPESIPARLALANFYWSTNRRTEGEAALHEALKLDPHNLIANKALYLMYLGSKRVAEAEAPLKVIAQNSPTADGRLALADYYAASQRMTEAKAIYEDVSKDNRYGSAAKLRLASLGLIDGDRATAYRFVDEVLAKEPRNVEALVGKAQLQLSDGKKVEALATAGLDHPPTHYTLGLVHLADGQTEEATAAFEESLRVGVTFAPANFELGRLALAARRYDDAIQFSRAAIQMVPGYGEAHLILARAEMLKGNVAGAEEPLRLLALNFPERAGVQAEVGRLLLMKNDLAGAQKAFTRALGKEPYQLEALEGITILDVRQNRTAAARTRLDAAVKANSNNSTLQLMASQLYSVVFKDPAAAEHTARQAVAADPNNLDAFGSLARLHAEANNLPAATAEFEKLAERQPRSVGNQTTVGLLLHLQGKTDEAKARYEKALALDPRAAVAANNLAQLYVDRNENLDVALNLAQIAKAGLPTAHQVDDTLGWIYYRKGVGLLAVTWLKQAVAAQPDNAEYNYHLGAAYALNKEPANARQSLTKALKLRPNFQGADDARKILDTLK